MTAQEALAAIESKFPGAVLGHGEFRGEISIDIPADSIRPVALFCRDTLGFDYLIDVASLDHFGQDPRWELVYELYSMADGIHLRLKSLLPEDPAEADTVSDIWPTADWHEREVFDMMGIRFKGHPDLRRILMWDGYPFYPLRKDFPLEGKPSHVEEIASSEVAPLAGGPFVTVPTDGTSQVREPRARHAGDLVPPDKFIAEP